MASGATSGQRPGLPNRSFSVKVPDDAESTKPFFTRPSIEQPYYDISNPAWRRALLCAVAAGGMGGVRV